MLATAILSVTQVDGSNGLSGREFPLPSGGSPSGIVSGPDGNLWFTEEFGNRIGRITPKGLIKEFSIPTADSRPIAIAAGRDGNLWFVETLGNKIGRITPAGAITEFPIPTLFSQSLDITAGPDGNMWFTESQGNIVGRITPAGVITEFHAITRDSFNNGITAGTDGNVWFVERASTANNIARITPDGAVSEFPIPTASAAASDIAAGPDGNLWFTEEFANKVGRINPVTGVVVEFPIPTANSHPFGITSAAGGALWFTELLGNKVGRIFPVGSIKEFPIPTRSSSPWGIAPGDDGNVWLTESNTGKIAVVGLPNPAEPNQAQQAAPIKLGTSGSNINDVVGGGSCCVSGTLGSLVKDAAGNLYILSNNHVLARSNLGSAGDPIIQRGYIDTIPGCSGNGAIQVANLSQFVPLDFAFVNEMDAAIAQVDPGQVDPGGAILGIGRVSSVTVPPALGMRVLKVGRTTGKTFGAVDVIHLNLQVRYSFGCDLGNKTIKFQDQFGILPTASAFSNHGDSGALVLKDVDSGNPNPVGLLFAGAPDGTTLATPIDTVLHELSVSMVGTPANNVDVVSVSSESNPKVEAAARVSQRNGRMLFSLPEVVGHGVGYSRSGSGEVVIRLLLRKATDAARRAAPSSLEGVPVEIQETGEFRNLPFCGKRQDAPLRP